MMAWRPLIYTTLDSRPYHTLTIPALDPSDSERSRRVLGQSQAPDSDFGPSDNRWTTTPAKMARLGKRRIRQEKTINSHLVWNAQSGVVDGLPWQSRLPRLVVMD